ncbi:hypothetical protein HF325_003836 [Metschnikowia pulcherrima]|uniref:Serine/threonine-protein kinase TEL1 n=1 Tax=Metschnikowia pulcherrima TaxID=27326 RepID=A0A8H7LBC7_9ASCO|nr:hypothetical protein HF325_003836 [Metschnikowia pulcherrima]
MSLLHHEKLAKDTANASMLSRVVAATHIRDKLLGAGLLYAKKYLLPIERLCTECVSLAEMKSARGRTLLLDKLKIGAYWMNELPTIPPPTLGIPVSNSGYANVPSMLTMDSKVSIASSGISLPKVVTFSLTDGRKHKMLLKHGTDDLRQDAIMEQVFEKVNKIFHEDKETRKRKLRVRTYSAVPLGPTAGVSEHTFRVLRGSKDHILAILDVLRWDPLYSWSISPLRNKKLQGANKDALGLEAKQDGSAASKAIFGVSDKLSAGGLSVEATVRELIREATSEQNLAVIYSGWSPFY